ncbi:MAG: molybdopterin molybdotransferase MoeA [Coriobacteriales bacterium]|jgi:molybdopterin molybdotransferase
MSSGQGGRHGAPGDGWDDDAIEQVLPQMPRRELVEQEIARRYRPRPTVERVAVDDALGRVLAHDVCATFDCPPAQTSCLDGIGVRFDDFADGVPDTSGWKLGRDYAVCDTGDDVPDAFDTVIQVENLLFAGADGRPFPGERGSAPFERGFSVAKAPQRRGECVNAPGSAFRAGETIVRAGERLTPERLSAAVGCGAQVVEVLARPRVAIIPTGDELVEPGRVPGRGATINSNAVLLSSYVRLLGGEPRVWPIQPDRHEEIARSVDEALATSDIVLVNAGSSKGSEDCGPHVLAERADIVIHHGQLAAPGRPAMCALTVDGKPMCVIPGPPVAADTAMHWLVFWLVGLWYGIDPQERLVKVRVDKPVKAGEFEFWRRCRIRRERDGSLSAELFDRGEMGGIETLGCADAIVRNPVDRDLEPGDLADALLLCDGFSL